MFIVIEIYRLCEGRGFKTGINVLVDILHRFHLLDVCLSLVWKQRCLIGLVEFHTLIVSWVNIWATTNIILIIFVSLLWNERRHIINHRAKTVEIVSWLIPIRLSGLLNCISIITEVLLDILYHVFGDSSISLRSLGLTSLATFQTQELRGVVVLII